jgi:hypothetical protein
VFFYLFTGVLKEINNLNIGLCQVVKREKDIKWRRTSVRKD